MSCRPVRDVISVENQNLTTKEHKVSFTKVSNLEFGQGMPCPYISTLYTLITTLYSLTTI